jgi:hypothetical protein
MNAKIKRVNELWEKASNLAIKGIIEEARKILKADNDLNEFIMAMGSCFFTYKELSKYDIFAYTDEEYEQMSADGHDWYGARDGILHDRFQPEFMEMVDDMNERFHVFGYPVRFTADGEEIHVW